MQRKKQQLLHHALKVMQNKEVLIILIEKEFKKNFKDMKK